MTRLVEVLRGGTPDKETQISKVLQRDHLSFASYLAKERPHYGFTDVPIQAMRYTLIPSELLESVEDPKRVQLTVKQPSFEQPLTVVAKVGYKEPFSLSSLRQDHNQLKPILSICLNTFVTSMPVHGNPWGLVLDDVAFMVDDKFRGKGIGTGYYKRLRECAKNLGYWAITGVHTPDSIGFYTQKLGRATLNQVKPEYRGIFLNSPDPIETGSYFISVDLLYDEDKLEYLD